MYFGDLKALLLDRVRSRIHNGELTERGLARLTGISQPHLHNALKGKRLLSTELADRLLLYMRVSVIDLIDPSLLKRYVSSENNDPEAYSFIPVLDGKIGPGRNWPSEIDGRERFPISLKRISRMWEPVVARLSHDPLMFPLFDEGDIAVLDQSQHARTQIDTTALYVIKRGETGRIRRLQLRPGELYVLTENSTRIEERFAIESLSLPHFVRARAFLISREREWTDHTLSGECDQDRRAA